LVGARGFECAGGAQASSQGGLLYPPQAGSAILLPNEGRQFGELQLTISNCWHFK